MYKLQVCHLLVADMCVTIEEEKGAGTTADHDNHFFGSKTSWRHIRS